MPTILIIDDNQSVALALEVLFSLADIETKAASTPTQGLAILDAEPIDLVIQDMNFSTDNTSGQEGADLFNAIRNQYPDLPIILLTAWTHLDAAVSLVKAGAADYLAKPWDDRRLLASVQNLLELGEVNQQLKTKQHREAARKHTLATQFDLKGYVWQDAATEQVIALACQIAKADVPVLITGPNGAGKEGLAEIIRINSNVKDGPFIVLNCGAIPADLIEAELFGVEAGAYTGATRSREGKFEAADGGTLFLDEIGNLPLSGQIKLLRVLETGRFARLGSNAEKRVSVRIISATNADLTSMIATGQFRQDLYYRLNLIELKLPALVARPDDILPLARHFLAGGKLLDEAAMRALQQHHWPGNVRELKNVLQRALLLSQGKQISVSDLGLHYMMSQMIPTIQLTDGSKPILIDKPIEPNRDMIEAALARTGGIVAQAAAELGLSRQALYRRMERLGLKGDAPSDALSSRAAAREKN
jgi:DNA-binding NtrC family response regulator